MNHRWPCTYSDAGFGSAQRRLGLAERVLREVESLQPRHDPHRALLDATAAQPGEALEHAVEHEAREEDLGRHVDRHVVLRADVLAAAEEVGDLASVVVELAAASAVRRRRCGA